MQSIKSTGQGLEPITSRWLQVCRTRGTPAPDQDQVVRFLASLPEREQAELEQALSLCLNGREKHRELAILSWAAACTRPAFLSRLHAHGLACGGHHLFAAGLGLMASGWDMSARIAQLQHNPQDVASLQAMLALQMPAGSVVAEAPPLPLNDPVSRPMAAAWPKPVATLDGSPEPPGWSEPLDPGAAHGFPPYRPLAAVPALEAAPSEALPPVPDPQDTDREPDPELALASPQERPQVRLFGRDSAHTLEIGPHRRGRHFMGVQVVTIESARAMPGGGYDWSRKLLVQLTPEEMPAAIAVLMNLSPSARFGQHGVDRDKFIELRRQEGGMVVVTGQGGSVYAVPVKTGNLYYLLGLFCQAMAQGLPSGSIAEVLALVKAIGH